MAFLATLSLFLRAFWARAPVLTTRLGIQQEDHPMTSFQQWSGSTDAGINVANAIDGHHEDGQVVKH
ncbi:hypothetical protein TYRP_022173 [Tyrophagus putrescentiae]|nr:hypothetical protein TYRP_022173 [Tyrophagus putrescentiae]